MTGVSPSGPGEYENDLQRGYGAWEEGKPFDRFQSAEWQDGWRTADDFAWWKRIASALGGAVNGFSHRYSGSLVIDGEYHQIAGSLLRKVAAIATEAGTAETPCGSVHEGADPKGIAQ